MKKIIVFSILFFFGNSMSGFSQVANPSHMYLGKWAVLVAGTPMGDMLMKLSIEQKEGKMVGKLIIGETERGISKLMVAENGIEVYFESSQAGEVKLELNKVDNDHLKGTVMGAYEATATRAKE